MATLALVPSAAGGTALGFDLIDDQNGPSLVSAAVEVTAAPPELVHGPRVVSAHLVVSRGRETGAALAFDSALYPADAADPSAYTVGPAAGRVAAHPASATYDPSTHAVTLRFARPFAAGTLVSLRSTAAALVGVGGLALDGNADGTPGGDYATTVATGPAISYRDTAGNLVRLSLAGGGTLELAEGRDGSVTSLAVIGARAGRSVLSGTVRRLARGSTGATSSPAVVGLSGVRVALTDPPFLGPTGLFPSAPRPGEASVLAQGGS